MDVVRLRVRYNETDQMGITYHGKYLDWFVIGRTELLRTLGLPYSELERNGLLLPVLEANCRYLGPTRYDDVVQLETSITELRRTRMTFRYEVWSLPSNLTSCASESEDAVGDEPDRARPVLVTSGETKHVFVDAEQRPIDVRKRFPDVWRVLEPLAGRLRLAVGDHVVAESP